MNGRFPYDVFIIIVTPFLMVAMEIFLSALLMPAHVHHRGAAAIAITMAVMTLIGSAVLFRRGRKTKG